MESLCNNLSISYEIDTITALIPVGARKQNSAEMYYPIYDGTYLRANICKLFRSILIMIWEN